MLRAKQIADANRCAWVYLKGVSASGGSVNITSVLSTALATAGRDGASVPVQQSLNGSGVGIRTQAGLNRVEIWDNTTEKKLGGNDEVYGRITFSNPNYVVTFYQLINGVETAYTLPGATSLQLAIVYVYDFGRLPIDFAISNQIYSDPTSTASGAVEKSQTDVLTPTALNTLPQLSKTPSRNSEIIVFVNGLAYGHVVGQLTISGKQLTWVRSETGADIDSSDRVFVRYVTTE
jgi:hypothetical protein